MSRSRVSHLLEACHTILFASTSVHRTIRRCVRCAFDDSQFAIFEPALQTSKARAEQLLVALERMDPHLTTQKMSTANCDDLVHMTTSCIYALRDLCQLIRTRQAMIMQALDAKFARHLLLNIHGATIDLKEAWQVLTSLVPSLSRPVPFTHSPSPPSIVAPTAQSPLVLLPAHGPHTACREWGGEPNASPLLTPISSPALPIETSQVLDQLEKAVVGTLDVIQDLKQWDQVPPELQESLGDLEKDAINVESKTRRLQSVASMDETSHQLDHPVWTDTEDCIKIIISIMIRIRDSVRHVPDKPDDLPKDIKQKFKKCYDITRAIMPYAGPPNATSAAFHDIPLQHKGSQTLVVTIDQPSHATTIKHTQASTPESH